MVSKIGLRFVPVVIIAAFWLPLLVHHFVWNETADHATIEKARQFPPDSDIEQIGYFYEPNHDDDDIVLMAQKLLSGEADIPGLPRRTLSLPFAKADVTNGSGRWQLTLASFRVPLIFLSAFEITGEEIYLQTARDIIIGWAEFEKGLWLPKGFIWNDHAMAARISVLAKFWKLYRNHHLYDPDAAQEIFAFLIRSARRLSKPAQFTFWSNHGLMQNIALLQLCVAFPDISHVAEYKATAIQRLHEQFGYYINTEGVVLEHSPGYHRDGIIFMSNLFRLLTMLEYEIPVDWRAKYDKALKVYNQLRRPDGSLPLIGDTGPWKDESGPLVCKFDESDQCAELVNRNDWQPVPGSHLYPVSGLANWWNPGQDGDGSGMPSQTAITWANYQGHAHKHADELSLTLWAAGYNWWTNIGYYPYGGTARQEAVSWGGSNAPHLAGEAYGSQRTVRLHAHDDFEALNFIDLARETPEGLTTRRQVFHLKAHNLWGVLDYNECRFDCRVRTIWTTAPEIQLTHNPDSARYTLTPDGESISLSAAIITSENSVVDVVKGGTAPFAGWVMTDPASAIVIEQSTNVAWAFHIWHLEAQSAGNSSLSGGRVPVVNKIEDAQNWRISIPVANHTIELSRISDRLTLADSTTGSQNSTHLMLSHPPDYREAQLKIEAAFSAASNKYSAPPARITTRTKASLVILGLFLFQELFLLVLSRMNKKQLPATVMIFVAWGAVYFYLGHKISG